MNWPFPRIFARVTRFRLTMMGTAMSFRFIVLLFAFVLASLPCHAESVVVGKTCAQLGASTMLSDQTGIAICARETAGSSTLVWKSMSGGGGGAVCGLGLGVYIHDTKDKAGAETTSTLTPVAKCEGQDVFTATGAANCPSGYKLKSMQASYVPESSSASAYSVEVGSYVITTHYFCVKD